MNPLEFELDYPFGDRLPPLAQRLTVAPGIEWIRMPLPFALDHINLYLVSDHFRGRDGWTLIDAGASTPETRAAWERLFADGLDGKPIVRIVCTHGHPDHIGLADWVGERFGAPLWITLGEFGVARILSAGLPGQGGENSAAHLRRNGLADEGMLGQIAARMVRHFPTLVPSVARSFRRIRDGESIAIGGRDWQVITGIGHSPEHATLYCEADGLMLSGDMVLPRISTNVAVWEMEPESDPVDWYLDSLRRMAHCRDDTLVLPSHGRPFRGLHRRIAQQMAHHADRLDAVMAACREAPRSAADLIPVLFSRALDAHQISFAMGEAIAHVHALWHRGEVTRTMDDDGVWRFSAA